MNYENIAKALEYYQARGYVYIQDAPWVVSKEVYYATKPERSVPDIKLDADVGEKEDQRYFVASGEQSFLQMMLDDQPLKQAICVTPCFRLEPMSTWKLHDWHRPYFMKAELINGQSEDVNQAHLMYMIHQACGFFEQFFPVRIVEKPDGTFDIVEKGTRVELGSYGIRCRILYGKTLRWIFGTACAEPRLSTVVARHNPGIR